MVRIENDTLFIEITASSPLEKLHCLKTGLLQVMANINIDSISSTDEFLEGVRSVNELLIEMELSQNHYGAIGRVMEENDYLKNAMSKTLPI